jgi:hypothetical protein
MLLTGLESKADAHGLDAQPHQKQQIVSGQELLHPCCHGIRKRIALQTLMLDPGSNRVQERLM